MMGIEPITRKEMFMASAAGESVSTPTPVTREEYFLSKIGGGGGGGGTQSDLSQTDITQPDYVKGVTRQESLPDGYPYKEIGTILDGTFEFIDGGSGLYAHQIADENFTIVDGKTYTIIWDGETYQCVATIVNDTLTLGNLGMLGFQPNTGEPFIFGISTSGIKSVYVNDTSATHMITVHEETIHPMAPEFLPALTSPNGTKYKLTVSDDGTLSAVQV